MTFERIIECNSKFHRFPSIHRATIGCNRINKSLQDGENIQIVQEFEGLGGLTGDPRKTMRWRRSMLVVLSSSRRGFLAAGRAADSPDTHPAESVGLAPADVNARTDALEAVLRPQAVGVRNRVNGEEELHGGAVRAAMASISWLAAAGCSVASVILAWLV